MFKLVQRACGLLSGLWKQSSGMLCLLCLKRIAMADASGAAKTAEILGIFGALKQREEQQSRWSHRDLFDKAMLPEASPRA
jgi:hypothetical protein